MEKKQDSKKKSHTCTKMQWHATAVDPNKDTVPKASEPTQQSMHSLSTVVSGAHRKQPEKLRDDEHDIWPKRTPTKKVENDTVLKDKTKEVSSPEDEWNNDDDEDPWLGCVCGKTHPSPVKVFWIQCEGCNAWYNVAEECVGFDKDAAKNLDEWNCWVCDPPVEGLGL